MSTAPRPRRVTSTLAAISLVFAGLRRVGPTTAAIRSTADPLVTVLLAVLLSGETLGALRSPAAS